MEMKSAIGKIVLYRQPDIRAPFPMPPGESKVIFPARDLPAIITRIDDDGTLDLMIFESVARAEYQVLSQDVTWAKETPQPRRWRWPEEA